MIVFLDQTDLHKLLFIIVIFKSYSKRMQYSFASFTAYLSIRSGKDVPAWFDFTIKEQLHRAKVHSICL